MIIMLYGTWISIRTCANTHPHCDFRNTSGSVLSLSNVALNHRLKN